MEVTTVGIDLAKKKRLPRAALLAPCLLSSRTGRRGGCQAERRAVAAVGFSLFR
jgi:hypothetical protein